MSDRETRGPWAEAVDEAAEDLRGTDDEDQTWGERQHEELDRIDAHLRSYEVDHASHSVKRPGARISLNSNEPHAEASVTLTVDHDRLHERTPLSMHVKTADGGMEEALTMADLTLEQAEDLHERLGEAIEAVKDGANYYER